MKLRSRLRKVNFGIIRVSMLRSMFLITVLNTVMLAGLFINTNGWHWWYILVPIGLALHVAFDLKVVWGQEIDSAINRSEEWMAIKQDLKIIKKKLEGNRVDDSLL